MLWSLAALVILAIARAWHRSILDPLVAPAYRLPLVQALTVAIAVLLFFFLDRLIRHHYWQRYLKQRRGREAPAVIKDVVTLVLLLLGLAIGLWWLNALSFPVIFTAVVATSGAVAFVASNALSPVILDLFSGLATNFDRSYGLGDWLTIYSQDPSGPLFGKVVGLTWRTTSLCLEDGTRLAIPNRLAALNPFVNHNRQPHTKEMCVEVSVDIRCPADRTLNMLLGECLKAMKRDGFASSPEPIVVVKGLSDGAAVYQIRFHAHPDRIAPCEARSIVFQAVLDLIQQNRLPLPTVQMEQTKSPDLEFNLGEREIVEALSRVALFRKALNSEQAQLLASRGKPVDVAKDEFLMQQGDKASSLFVILEGAACVWIAETSGERKDVAVLAMGDVVGEMSLLTGAPRNANVTALTRLRAFEITKHALAELVEKSPEILERFSHILARRQHELNELAQRGRDKHTTEGDLLARMKAFFSYAFGGSATEKAG